MRCLFLVLLVAALAQTAGAQSRSKLDERAKGEFRIVSPRILDPCKLGIAVEELGLQAHMLVGFQSAPDCFPGSRLREGLPVEALEQLSTREGDFLEVLKEMSTRQAFDHLMTLMPMYSWKEMDGVIVVRPKAAWDNPEDLLNLPTRPFETTNEPLDDVLHILLQAVTPSVFSPHRDARRPQASFYRPVAVAFPGGTMLEAVNAVVRARPAAFWEMGYTGRGHATIILSALIFDPNGAMAMAPVALPPAHR
jgi:hypothetical protein